MAGPSDTPDHSDESPLPPPAPADWAAPHGDGATVGEPSPWGAPSVEPAAPGAAAPSVELAAPVGPATAGLDDRPWWRRRVAALPVVAWLVVAVAAVAAIVAGAWVLGDDDDDSKLAVDVPRATAPAPSTDTSARPVTTPPGTTAVTTSPASAPGTTTVDSTVPTPAATTVPAGVGGDGSAPERPLPAGDPEQSAFRYDDGFGTVWSGTITGVVETPLYWDDEHGERCFVVLGTLTPEVTPGLVSNAWSAPYLTLFVDGEEAELGQYSCQTEPVVAAGYRSLYDTTATVGTTLAVFAEFSLPESVGVPQAVAVGSPSAWTFFDATLLAEVPAVAAASVGPLPVEPLPLVPGAPGTFQHVNDYTGDTWSGTITGLVEVPLDDGIGIAGRCLAVIGTLTADEIGSGLTATAYAAPPLAVVADGVLVDDYYGCSSAPVEAAGYRWFNDSEITAGTTVAVYATLIIPEPAPGEVQAIVVGDAWDDTPTVLAPLVLDAVPPAPITPGPPPAVELAATGVPVDVAQEYDDTAWRVTVHGVMTSGDCLVVFARATLVEGEVQVPPELFLIAGGRLLPESFDCDTAAFTDAGYAQQWTEPAGVGASVDMYAAFRLPPGVGDPQAIVVGRVGMAGPVAVAPTVIAAIPPVTR